MDSIRGKSEEVISNTNESKGGKESEPSRLQPFGNDLREMNEMEAFGGHRKESRFKTLQMNTITRRQHIEKGYKRERTKHTRLAKDMKRQSRERNMIG